jgi:predicted lysophospholipase L1 biosynthesis ABC-type transport system permease subunit
MLDKARYSEVMALALTAAVVAFVGAIVVLTIPYAIFTIPLPASVNPFFGLLLYLLVPSGLFALWVGYKFYRWGCENIETSRGDQT